MHAFAHFGRSLQVGGCAALVEIQFELETDIDSPEMASVPPDTQLPRAPARLLAAPRALALVRVAAVTAVYLAAARLCVDLPVRAGEFSPVWVPSGIVLVAVLRWGPWMASAAFLGEFAAVLDGAIPHLTLTPVATGLGLATGNALEVLVIVAVLDTLNFQRAFSRTADVFAFVCAIVAGAAISATTGVATLLLVGLLTRAAIASSWQVFWSSVVLGDILVAPVLLSWRAPTGRTLWRRHPLEIVAVPLLLVVVSVAIFDRQYLNFMTLFLLFPLFVWATLSFGARGASASVLIVAAVGVWATVHGDTTVRGVSGSTSSELLQGTLCVIAITNLLLTALLVERDAARHRAWQAAHTLERAQSTAHVGSWEWDMREGSAMEWSAQLRELLNLLGAAGTPTLAAMLAGVHHEDRHAVESRIRNAQRARGAFEVEHRAAGPAGHAERELLHVGAVQRVEGEGERMLGAVLDITEHKAAQRSKSALISMASHELRTPLTSIIGFSDTLTNHWDTLEEAEILHFVRIIRDQGVRMSALVADTLVQSEVDRGALTATSERIDVEGAIHQALGGINATEVRVRCDIGLSACGSRRHFEQIVDNLVVNAGKYGSPPIVVSAVRAAEGIVEIRVRDHGPGVAREFVPHLFERFTRGAGADLKPGTGLGLSIVRGLARASGGEVRYERERDETAFVVTMPEWTE
jgi:signal transduction histidine kinase